MSRDPKSAEVDLEGLLEAVHGRTDESRREQQVEAALRAIETTHRAASVAVRNFERHGRLQAEASVLAALGALADDSQAPPEASQAAEAEATAVGPVPGREQATVVASKSPSGAGPAARTDAAEPIHPSQEATAIYRPRPLSDEATQAPAAPAANKAGGSSDVTQTHVAPLGDWQPPAEPHAGSPHRAASAAAPPADESMRPARIFSGRGKDVGPKEVTRTNVIRRPKA